MNHTFPRVHGPHRFNSSNKYICTGTGFNNTVNIIKIDPTDNSIYVGGSFSIFNGTESRCIVKLDSFGAKINSFSTAPGFRTDAGVHIEDIYLRTADIIVTGLLEYHHDDPIKHIVALKMDGLQNRAMTWGTAIPSNSMGYTIVAGPITGSFIVSGNFGSYNGLDYNGTILLNNYGDILSHNYNRLGWGFFFDSHYINGIYYFESIKSSLKVDFGPNDTVYYHVGRFSGYNSTDPYYSSYPYISIAKHIVALDTDGVPTVDFDIGFNNNTYCVYAIDVDKPKQYLYLVGDFNRYKNSLVNLGNIIKIDRYGIQQTFNSGQVGFNDIALCVKVSKSGKIYVGGSFTTYRNVSYNRLIRLNSDGSPDTAFNIGTGFNDTIECIELDENDNVYVGGAFTTYDGTSVLRFAKLDDKGNLLNNCNIVNYGYYYPYYNGGLYNGYAALLSDLAPVGWHIPTKTEWDTLMTYLGGASVAGGKLKDVGTTKWRTPNTGAVNSVGFRAVANGTIGQYSNLPYEFQNWNRLSVYWSSTPYALSLLDNEMHVYQLSYLNDGVNESTNYIDGISFKVYGFSIRCIRDNTNGYTENETVIDYDGNIYNTIVIGSQIWMAQDLKVTHRNNGVAILQQSNATLWPNAASSQIACTTTPLQVVSVHNDE